MDERIDQIIEETSLAGNIPEGDNDLFSLGGQSLSFSFSEGRGGEGSWK